MPVNFPQLFQMRLDALRQLADELEIPESGRIRKHDLVFTIGQKQGEKEQSQYGTGVLEVHAEGFGFLRSPSANFLSGQDDIYVSQSQIRRFKLQTGDSVIGVVRPPKEGERYLALLRVESINGEPPGDEPPSFDTLTAIYPDDRIHFGADDWLRVIDLAAPMGLGQRGILVATPRTGRVELLRRLVDQLASDEDLNVTVLLVGERPEEIHEWRQATRAEVIATPFDEPPARHVQVADIVFERARRMVERGDDSVLIVDSLSRLLRFCLAELPPSGRDLGGVDAAALHRIRRYLGAARALEEGGSLTVVGVVSGDIDSKMDRVLLDDLREVVNWEVTLSRDVADRGIRPPVDVHHSGTLQEERLLDEAERRMREDLRSKFTGDPIEDAETLVAYRQAPAA
jgi:transcription termination factor Rho